MEEQGNAAPSSLVYFCASAPEEVHELYHKNSPPDAASTSADARGAGLDGVLHNVRMLLDEHQGDFDQVFLSSSYEQCLDRVDTTANAGHAVVLVELPYTSSNASESHASSETKRKSSLHFLRTLAGDIQGSRYLNHVMPFVLLTFDEGPDADSSLTSACLQAGAVDIVHSPLTHEDINRVVGHVKETTRAPARLLGAPMAQNLVDSIRNTSEPTIACRRPDQTLTAKQKAGVEAAIQQWHFPAQDFNMDELTYAALFMLEHLLSNPELQSYAISRPRLMTFLLATRRQYKHEREVHYHNWRHAVDVTQSIYCFLLGVGLCPPPEDGERIPKERNALERMLTHVDALILLVSAIGHDVGHPGVNNAFLVACNHPLAQTYNDKSVLENYHCAAYSQLLRRHWPSLSNIAGFRATMISTILATDMQRHFEYMSSLGDLKAKMESKDPTVEEWSDKDRDHARELTMALLMKAADISNVARPFPISARWAKILMNEFARQGELESELQMPTCLFGGPPNKADVLAAAQSQKGFMSLFGLPLFRGISEIMPTVSCSNQELENNQNTWDQKIKEEKERQGSGQEPGHLTFSSVTKDEVEEARAFHHKSEPSAVPAERAQPPSTPTKRTPTATGESSPSKHAIHDLRHQLVQGVTFEEDKRSSAPFLGSPAGPLSPTLISSRRSSKDVALDQLQQLTALAQQSLGPGSRRGSADAGWHLHQSYPGSRRGSKDESLTTILVTSGSSPNRRSSPSSPGRPAERRPSIPQNQKHPIAPVASAPAAAGGGDVRTSFPSSRSHTTSSATANTMPHSPSTQPSSLAPDEDDEPTPPAADASAAPQQQHHPSIPATEDPFLMPGNWPSDYDGTPSRSSPQISSAPPGNSGLPGAPDASSSPPARTTPTLSSGGGEADDSARSTPRKGAREREAQPQTAGSTGPGSGGGTVRESRSRSRLRGLKFWKRSRDREKERDREREGVSDATAGVAGGGAGGSP